jgi:hypothetical protein
MLYCIVSYNTVCMRLVEQVLKFEVESLKTLEQLLVTYYMR